MRTVDAASRLFAYAREYGIYKTIVKLINRAKKIFTNLILSVGPLDSYAYERSVKIINKIDKNKKDVEKIIDDANKFEGFGLYKTISPQQDKYEIKGLAEVVNNKKPSTIVEIGTAEGGTLYLWSRYIDSAQKIVSVDLGLEFKKRHKFFEKFNEEKDLTFVEGRSQKEKTFKNVFEETKKSVDFLFIDGDHSYEGVRKDFEIYSDIVNSGGIVAFHDIIETGYENMGVPRLWEEIKEDYNSEEIINPKSEQGGIGMLRF
nr:class I SAM-dependent methyltransferase [Salinibacter ruber]